MIDFNRIGNWQKRQIYEIAKTELSLQDLPMNLDELTELKDSSAFKIKQTRLAPYKIDVIADNLLEGIVILMDSDLIVIERTGYVLLDFLSDVGGLLEILIRSLTVVLSILNYDYVTDYIVSKLYIPKSDKENIKFEFEETNRLLHYAVSKFLPQKLVCCRKSPK